MTPPIAIAFDDLVQFLPGLGCDESFPYANWRLYGLIDPALGEDEGHLAELGLPSVSLPLRHPDYPKSSRPYLLDAGKLAPLQLEQFAQRFVERAYQEAIHSNPPGAPRKRSFAALIMTPQPANDLSIALARAADVVDSTHSARTFRFWDPRVAQHMTRPPLLWRDVIPGLQAYWWFVDSRANLMRHQLSDIDDGRESGKRRQLCAETEAWLAELGNMNACFERVRGDVRANDDVIWRELETCLNAASALGLSGEDRVLFSAQRWQHRAALEHAPRMKELMLSATQHGLTYTALQAELDDEDWDEIIAQANSSQGIVSQQKRAI